MKKNNLFVVSAVITAVVSSTIGMLHVWKKAERRGQAECQLQQIEYLKKINNRSDK